jgi:hypothetical protein
MNRNRLIRWLVFAALMCALSAGAFAQVFVSVRIGPPALPVYAQPICPGPGYIWTPGYWAWDDDDGYYWVPGTWVVAPVGLLWTPGYWGWNEGFYVFHAGYWGPHVGFYGGINYGFGYTGVGFFGGEWHGREFFYNRSVTNVNVTNVTNVYNKTVIVNNTTHVSYNGGTGGVAARPNEHELAAEHEHHQEPLREQTQHQHAAAQNRELRASVNQGRPAIAATARPADFHSAVPAKAAGAAYHPPAMSPREARGPATSGNRPFTPANSNNRNASVNRPSSEPSPRDNAKSKSNEGFRPFKPPANSSKNSQDSRNAKPSSVDRSFNPPAKNNAGNRPMNDGPTSHRSANNDRGASGNSPMREPQRNASRGSAPPPRESRPPQHESRPVQHEAAPRQAAPQHAAPQHHESAPPPRKESAPKENNHHPGKGR